MEEIILKMPDPIKAIPPPPSIKRTIIFDRSENKEGDEDDNTQD